MMCNRTKGIAVMQVFVLIGCSEHQYHNAIRILVAAGLTSWLEWWLNRQRFL